MLYTDLGQYYRLIFGLIQHHKYSLTEVEHMLPYERDLYVDMLIAHIEKQNEQQRRK